MLVTDSRAIQRAMLQCGISVTELADITKSARCTISILSREDRRAHMPTIHKLAKALQVEPLSLVKAVS